MAVNGVKLLLQSGVYETEYGNACEYFAGDTDAYDMDMAETIPLEMVDFSRKIRNI